MCVWGERGEILRDFTEEEDLPQVNKPLKAGPGLV